jgi:hypothetical protein
LACWGKVSRCHCWSGRGDVRSIFEKLDILGQGATIEGKSEQTGVRDNGAHVALVKGRGVLAARDLVKLWVLP